MNVSVSTDGLHSPVCVFYVDSSPPWPAESAVSGPPDPPYILYNSPTLSVVTDAPPFFYTSQKATNPWCCPPTPFQYFTVKHPSLLTKQVKEKKKKCVLSVFRSGKTWCLSTQICSLFVCSSVEWRQEKITSWSSYLGDISVCNPRSPACVIIQPTFSVLLSHYIYTHYTQNVNTVRLHSDGLSVLLLLERQQLIIQLTIKHDCDSLPEARVSKLMIKNWIDHSKSINGLISHM